MRALGKTRLVAPLVAIALLVGACDSSGDDDEVSLVGSWNVTQIAINGQNMTALILGQAGIESLGASFESTGAMEIYVMMEGERFATSGTYTASGGNLVLQSDSFAAPLDLTYTTQNSSTVVLTSDDVAILSELSGVDPGSIPFQVERIDITIRRQ